MIHVIREDEEQISKNLTQFVPSALIRRASDEKPGTSSSFSKYKMKQIVKIPKSEFSSPISRLGVIEKLKLREDSVIKVRHEGKLVPWSMLDKCEKDVEIRICRPHQNVKPQLSEAHSGGILISRKVEDLEARLASLEAVDPANLSAKTDKDLQLLTKQMSFLAKRLDEADQADWIKKT